MSQAAASREALSGRPFAKMNGIGNAILIVDLRDGAHAVTPDETRALAETFRFDQLMAIHAPRAPDTDAFVAIFNNDGSSAGACGNGTRCVAWFLLRDDGRERIAIATDAGCLECRRLGPFRFAVDMGRPVFAPSEIPVRTMEAGALAVPDALGAPFVVGMGNPHAVFFVPDADAVDLARVGPPIEHADMFPERANVSFAQVIDCGHLKLRVWERGAGATLACGTAACATLVAAASTGRSERAARIDLPGGSLEIEWRADDHVVMTGPVALECAGRLGQHEDALA